MELEKINTEILAFNALKEKALILGTKCSGIIVNNAETLKLALQTVGEANDVAKFIEDRRKTIKAPILDIGKQIDDKAKELTALLQPGITFGKEQIKTWNDAQEKIRQEELLKVQQEAAEAQRKDDERKQKIKDYLIGMQRDIEDKISKCETKLACDNLKSSIQANFPDASLFHEFESLAVNLKSECLKMIDAKNELIGNNLKEVLISSINLSDSIAEVEAVTSKEVVDAIERLQDLEASKVKG